CEVGGTVGDIESLPFLEAIRQLSLEVGYHNHVLVHVTLVPYIKASEELKTKPTQHSVMKLREIGLTPDFIFCRTDRKLTKSVRDKLALFCNVSPDHVIEGLDVPSIYEVPLVLHKQEMGQEIMDRMELLSKPNIEYLEKFIHRFKNPTHEVNIAMCGKYTELPDAYKSILEAFVHSGVENNASVNVKWVNTEKIYNDADAAKAF
ncbi:MAG TPA: CTP synthase, partial [Candidatus Marinimicrobia bacterium]|nr:CTP synthase [Candidatus Neomarinimicrobiota bacterium]